MMINNPEPVHKVSLESSGLGVIVKCACGKELTAGNVIQFSDVCTLVVEHNVEALKGS